MRNKLLIKTAILACTLFMCNNLSADESGVLLERGIFLQETKKDFSSALEIYQEALEEYKRESNHSEILFRIAETYKELGKTKERKRTLKKVVELGHAKNKWVEKAKKLIIEIEKEDQPTAEVLAARDTILKATKDRDRDLFKSVCNKMMKDALTEELFAGACDAVTPILEKEYKITFHEKESALFDTYVWLIDGVDHPAIKLVISFDRKGLVGGCIYR